jgi:hypothetical protein
MHKFLLSPIIILSHCLIVDVIDVLFEAVPRRLIGVAPVVAEVYWLDELLAQEVYNLESRWRTHQIFDVRS